MLRNLFLTVAVMALSGCGMNEQLRVKMVTDRAKFDMSCENVNITKLSDTSYGASGCERKGTYILVKCGNGYKESVCNVSLDAAQDEDTSASPQ